MDSPRGPSIKYVTLFLANFDPSSLCHTLSHIPGPPSTSHISNPPFLATLVQNPDKSPLYKFSLNCSQAFLSGGFVRESFALKVLSGAVSVRSSFCQNTSVRT